MRFQFFINQQTDEAGRLVGFMDGYQPEHQMELADAGHIEKPDALDDEILESLFYTYNCEHPEGYRNRSMSVGDVVVLGVGSDDVRAYRCVPVGFEPIGEFHFPVPPLIKKSLEQLNQICEKLARGASL